MLIHAVLAFALVETLALALLLWIWADQVAGARLLVAFLGGIAVWVVGNELPNWLGPETEGLAIGLISTAPLVAALFLHFCAVFCGVQLGRWGLRAVYGLGLGATLLAHVVSPGHLIHTPHIGYVAVPSVAGVVVSLAWVALGSAGVVVLVRALARARQPEFSQIAAVSASCAWGFFCLTGYGMAAAGLPWYPWPLLGLPAYSLILVFGILRYRVFVVNAWARRGLAWALLLALGGAVVALTPLLPFESRWVGGLAVAATCLALNGPVRRFAGRLVYPGGEVGLADLAAWRAALLPAESADALARQAAALLGQRIGMPVLVLVAPGVDTPLPAAGMPSLVCQPQPSGWAVALQGWDAAPPGPRLVAEMFGAVVAEAAARVEQARQMALRERESQLQARLAELGALAATVAHDIRNPLNIIAMAVAAAPGETRREVASQVARIAHLSSDLLDYAKPWKLALAPLDLAALARQAAARVQSSGGGGVSFGPGLAGELRLQGDARRIEQALANLLENAQTASAVPPANPGAPLAADGAPAATGPRIHLDAEVTASGVCLHVCDDGPGIPDDIRPRLFEPFASRSPGGTGLGLSIVARIMGAHGGSVALTPRPPWTTCFTLSFPANPP